jgi:uncharacterized membrane protein YfcA
MIEFLIIPLAFIQNVAFSMVSRARNRSNMVYHAICSVMSNGLWLASFSILGVEILIKQNYWMFLPYIIGTVAGSLFGSKISMKIEKRIGAVT